MADGIRHKQSTRAKRAAANTTSRCNATLKSVRKSPDEPIWEYGWQAAWKVRGGVVVNLLVVVVVVVMLLACPQKKLAPGLASLFHPRSPASMHDFPASLVPVRVPHRLIPGPNLPNKAISISALENQ